MTNADFFIALLHRLKSYEDATVLTLMVTMGGVDTPIRTSLAKVADLNLGGLLPKYAVQRSIARLQEAGLITASIYPSKHTDFQVNEGPLQELLAKTFPVGRFTPGLTAEDVPFLTRIQSAAPATELAASEPHIEHSIQEETP